MRVLIRCRLAARIKQERHCISTRSGSEAVKIGEPERTYTVEPLEDPVPREPPAEPAESPAEPSPAEEPVEPERAPPR
jgi:hypothetical protein